MREATAAVAVAVVIAKTAVAAAAAVVALAAAVVARTLFEMRAGTKTKGWSCAAMTTRLPEKVESKDRVMMRVMIRVVVVVLGKTIK